MTRLEQAEQTLRTVKAWMETPHRTGGLHAPAVHRLVTETLEQLTTKESS